MYFQADFHRLQDQQRRTHRPRMLLGMALHDQQLQQPGYRLAHLSTCSCARHRLVHIGPTPIPLITTTQINVTLTGFITLSVNACVHSFFHQFEATGELTAVV